MTTRIDKTLSAKEAAELELLSSGRKLPPSATDVRLHFVQFQDPFMRVRFDAPVAEARQFAESQTGQKLMPGCSSIVGPDPDPEWWLSSCPAGASFTSMTWSDDPPARTIVVVPNGATATVWLETFGK